MLLPYYSTPLYTFGHEFDIFTVCTAYNSILANLDIISNKCTLNNCAGGNFYAWHQYTVNDLGTLADFASGEQYRMLNFTFDNTALCDKCFVDFGIWSYVLRKSRCRSSMLDRSVSAHFWNQ